MSVSHGSNNTYVQDFPSICSFSLILYSLHPISFSYLLNYYFCLFNSLPPITLPISLASTLTLLFSFSLFFLFLINLCKSLKLFSSIYFPGFVFCYLVFLIISSCPGKDFQKNILLLNVSASTLSSNSSINQFHLSGRCNCYVDVKILIRSACILHNTTQEAVM